MSKGRVCFSPRRENLCTVFTATNVESLPSTSIKRQREEITERKKSLAGLMSNIAEIGGANVERKIGKASVRDAIIGTGVAIDKMLALTGQTPVAIQIANVQLPTP